MTNRSIVRICAVVVAGSALLFDPWGWAPFGPVKWLLISVTIPLAVAMVRRWSIHRFSAIGWGIFLGWMALCSVLGVDPLHAWIGTPDRRLGFVTFVLTGCAFLVGQQLRRPEDLRLLALTTSAVVAGTSLYAIGEAIGIAPVDLAGVRPGGTYGNAAYLGAALVLMVPVAVSVGISETGRWRVFGWVSAIVGLVALVIAESRAALLGAVVAALVFVWSRRGRIQPLRLVLGVAVVGVMVALTPAGARFGQLLDEDDRGSRGRIAEWRIAIGVVGDSPLVGHGPEGYRIAFPAQVDAQYERDFGRTVMPDRAHSGVLDIAAIGGIPALGAYLLAIGWLLTRVRRAISESLVLAGIGVGVVGYLVQQQFLFPVFEIEPVMWLLAGALVTATRPNTHQEGARVAPEWRAPYGLRTTAAAFGIVALGAGVLDLAADHLLLDAYSSPVPTVAADLAFDLRPDSIRYGFGAAAVARASGELVGAIDRIEAVLRLSPNDPTLLTTRGRYLLDYAAASGDVQPALAALESLVSQDPNHAENRLRLGLAWYLAGDLARAETELKVAADLAPRSPVPHINHAILLLDQGRVEEASDALDRARRIDPDDPRLDQIEAQIAAAAK